MRRWICRSRGWESTGSRDPREYKYLNGRCIGKGSALVFFPVLLSPALPCPLLGLACAHSFRPTVPHATCVAAPAISAARRGLPHSCHAATAAGPPPPLPNINPPSHEHSSSALCFWTLSLAPTLMSDTCWKIKVYMKSEWVCECVRVSVWVCECVSECVSEWVSVWVCEWVSEFHRWLALQVLSVSISRLKASSRPHHARLLRTCTKETYEMEYVMEKEDIFFVPNKSINWIKHILQLNGILLHL